MTNEKSEVRLYTTMPLIAWGPKRKGYAVTLNDAIGEKAHAYASMRCEGESPGVIVQNSEGSHSIYGLHSSYNPFFEIDTTFMYGHLETSKNLLKLIGHADKTESIINGCVIGISSVIEREGVENRFITISPDYDLRGQFPERFDDALVKSLERTISEYITDAKTKDRVEGIIMPETVKWKGSPTSHKFYQY